MLRMERMVRFVVVERRGRRGVCGDIDAEGDGMERRGEMPSDRILIG